MLFVFYEEENRIEEEQQRKIKLEENLYILVPNYMCIQN